MSRTHTTGHLVHTGKCTYVHIHMYGTIRALIRMHKLLQTTYVTAMRIFMLAEKGINFASGGVATSSPIKSKGYARNAIDGNPDGIYAHKSCSQTFPQYFPWWKLKLEHEVLFHSVKIVNRADCCGKLSDSFVFSEVFPAVTHVS